MADGPKDQVRADRLHAQVLASPDGVRPGSAGVLAQSLALLVIASTVALIPLGVWLVVALPNRVMGLLLGGLVLAVVWSVRPRRSRLPDDAVVLDRAPALRSLLDDIARAVGTTAPRTIAVVPEIQATVYDGRRAEGRVLLLGAPLWVSLPPQEKVALLGHELAHSASGDTRRLGIVGGAFEVLGGWRYLLDGDYVDGGTSVGSDGSYHGLMTTIAGSITMAALWVVGLVPLLLGKVLERLTSRDSQRAEYRADRISAAVAGRDAAVRSLQIVRREAAVDTAMQRAAIARRPVLEAVRELDLLAEPAPAASTRHDVADRLGTHPPIPYRIKALQQLPPISAQVVVDHTRSAGVDADLAAAFGRVERRLRDRYL